MHSKDSHKRIRKRFIAALVMETTFLIAFTFAPNPILRVGGWIWTVVSALLMLLIPSKGFDSDDGDRELVL